MNTSSLICGKCGKAYTTRGSLNRHIRFIHKVKQQYVCNDCGSKYDYKSTLQRHIITKHPDICDVEKFECSHCGRMYLHKPVLINHISQKHMQDCQECDDDETYSHRSQIGIKRVECHDCGRRFSFKHSLLRHIRAQHSEKECNKCGEKFRCNSQLRRHVESRHSVEKPPIERKTFTCLLCNNMLSSEFHLLDHFKIVHELEMSIENLRFDSEREFTAWKLDAERQHRCTYITRDKYKNSTTQRSTVVLRCNRSGFHTPVRSRMRKLKIQGSKKLNGFCPSKILVHVTAEGVHNVVFTATHVGHTNDLKELAHMNYSRELKDVVVKKLASGLSPAKIVADIARTSSSRPKSKDALDKIDLLSEKDIYNIANAHNISVKNRVRDPAGVDDWVAANEESICFYKRQGDVDRSEHGLRDDDFVLVFMKREQVDTFARLSPNCVLVDGTYGRTYAQANYLLHTVVVVDKYGKGYPVCFLIANREDASILDLMFACMRRKFGAVRANVFISDMQTGYWDSWSRVMKTRPQHHLHCSWHLLRAWSKKYARLKPPDKKTALSQRLNKLLHENDVASFHRQLDELLNDDDPDLQPFVAYFRDTYASTYKKWAVCYRQYAGISTNIRLNRAKLFKYSQGRGLTIGQVRNTLIHLDKFLFRKIRSEIRENVLNGFGCDVDASESNLDEKLYDLTQTDDEETELGCDVDVSMQNIHEMNLDEKLNDLTGADEEERELDCDMDASVRNIHDMNLDEKSFNIEMDDEDRELGCDIDIHGVNLDEKSCQVTDIVEEREKPRLYVMERIEDNNCPDCSLLCTNCHFCPHQFRCLCLRNASGEGVEQIDEVEVIANIGNEPLVIETVFSESVGASGTSKEQSIENRKQRLKAQFEEFINESCNDSNKFDMLQKYFENMKRTLNSMESPNTAFVPSLES